MATRSGDEGGAGVREEWQRVWLGRGGGLQQRDREPGRRRDREGESDSGSGSVDAGRAVGRLADTNDRALVGSSGRSLGAGEERSSGSGVGTVARRTAAVSEDGKMQKPLPNLLKEYDLPVGLFPQDVSTYEFKEGTKQLTVNLPLACEVRYRDQSFVRFNTTITGFLEKGRMYDVEGIKTKISVIWPMVSCVTTEGTKIHLQTTVKRTTRERAPYEMLRDSIGLDKF
ncbi:uncharacterized protein A4U43_C08F33930 [Asparagus officinalis]|nr:uncharacterized protein A4U43_C08F33930 [Asparagus officinalis]